MLIDEISEKVAKELSLSTIQVKAINRIQWKFLLQEIQSGNFNPVHIMYLGKFVKNARVKNGKLIYSRKKTNVTS